MKERIYSLENTPYSPSWKRMEVLLIINKQIGKNGRSFDETQDIMHVEINRSDYNLEIESFTITIDERATDRKLSLK